MENKDIIKGNKLIAEFIGWCLKTYPTHMRTPFHGRDVWWSQGKTKTFCGFDGELLFHDSWDWLMPVIGKISNQCEEPEELDDLKYALLSDDIDSAYKFVVSYLESYNSLDINKVLNDETD